MSYVDLRTLPLRFIEAKLDPVFKIYQKMVMMVVANYYWLFFQYAKLQNSSLDNGGLT